MSQDTASRRAATGLDDGARSLVAAVLHEVANLDVGQIMTALFRDRYGTPDDYYEAVAEVHGSGASRALRHAVDEAIADAQMPRYFGPSIDPHEAAARTLLLRMPEPDFRLAVEEALRITGNMRRAAARITTVCGSRGAPWIFDKTRGFEWVGDAEVQRSLVEPALSALHDRRFSGGVRSEFESARAELRLGTPQALKQAIHEAGCSVESAMKASCRSAKSRMRSATRHSRSSITWRARESFHAGWSGLSSRLQRREIRPPGTAPGQLRTILTQQRLKAW